MVSRLIPDETVIATMFDFWILELTTGIAPVLSSVFGTWAAGNASRIRCKCLVRIAVRRARVPSSRNIDCFDGGILEVECAVKDGPAAAA